ncbi:MAG: 4-hydroxy-tetrahydrodipicolinate reductase, partial [bacterium]
MSRIRVAVSGAAGRMGRAAVRTVARENDMLLVAALGRERGVGRDAGELAGAAPLGVTVSSDPAQVFAASPDVWVEFAPGSPAAAHARAALEQGISPVVGSTGIAAEEIERLGALAASRRIG